jgi:hypothetical protein
MVDPTDAAPDDHETEGSSIVRQIQIAVSVGSNRASVAGRLTRDEKDALAAQGYRVTTQLIRMPPTAAVDGSRDPPRYELYTVAEW